MIVSRAEYVIIELYPLPNSSTDSLYYISVCVGAPVLGYGVSPLEPWRRTPYNTLFLTQSLFKAQRDVTNVDSVINSSSLNRNIAVSIDLSNREGSCTWSIEFGHYSWILCPKIINLLQILSICLYL